MKFGQAKPKHYRPSQKRCRSTQKTFGNCLPTVFTTGLPALNSGNAGAFPPRKPSASVRAFWRDLRGVFPRANGRDSGQEIRNSKLKNWNTKNAGMESGPSPRVAVRTYVNPLRHILVRLEQTSGTTCISSCPIASTSASNAGKQECAPTTGRRKSNDHASDARTSLPATPRNQPTRLSALPLDSHPPSRHLDATDGVFVASPAALFVNALTGFVGIRRPCVKRNGVPIGLAVLLETCKPNLRPVFVCNDAIAVLNFDRKI